MKKVILYWNHICVLHNQEKKQLELVKKNLEKKGILLEVKFFGLGYESHMCEYLLREDCVLPDIIVSADLEVFELNSIYNSLGKLHDCESWLPLKENDMVQSLRRKSTLLPFLAIPLVCYTRDLSHCENKTILEVTSEKGFCFGGINNSAAKTISKLTWEKYGKTACEDLLDKSEIYDMPIAAFQSVRMEQNKTALVPSLYALRQDGKSTFMTTLNEGAFFLPSYFAACESISEETAKIVMNEIISQEFCEFYATNGNLLVCPEIETSLKVEDKLNRAAAVSQNFLNELDNKEFYKVYTDKIPTARNLA